MIIIGDIASPGASYSEAIKSVFSNNPEIFSGKCIVCNFEGLLYNGSEISKNEPILFNHPSILKNLDQGESSVLCMANNHILDLPEYFDYTKEQLDPNKYYYVGAGKSITEAESPVFFTERGQNFILFNFCWDFLLYNHKNPRSGIYVAKLNENKLIEKIIEFKKSHPGHSIIIYLHWSLDMEILPFPMYRQFSRALIDAGADLVVGCHSHCVQGGEKYKDGYVIYGLGNFFIPEGEFAGGNLRFPDFARIELVLEWSPGQNAVCHWFEYQGSDHQHKLKYLGSDDFETSKRLEEYSPYRTMSDKIYMEYFRKNRRKKILIPVYKDYRRRRLNKLYDRILKMRAGTAHFLAKINLIKWQN